MSNLFWGLFDDSLSRMTYVYVSGAALTGLKHFFRFNR
jgi:hypothetical protein